MSRLPLSSRGGSSSAFSRSSAVLRKRGKQVREGRSLIRGAARILVPFREPRPDEISANGVVRVPPQAAARPRWVHAAIKRLLDRMRERQLVAIWIGQVEVSFAP